MPSKCLFEFDRPNPIYYSGETVRARVTLTTTSEKTCREVYLEFKGEAKVRWSQKRSRGRSTTYRGQESYISNHTTLHPECELPPGVYTYNFDITLPEEAPSSCVGRWGHISYELSLVIDRPFRFDNVFRRPLTVLKNFNLNFHPELLLPLHGEDIKYLCCWPCKSGPIVSTLVTEFGGFAPGQTIKYTLQIDNLSNGYDLDGAHLRLIQTYSFTATTPRKRTRTVKEKKAEIIHNEPVLRFSKRILEGNLCIPSTPPSTQYETIITVKYHMEMAIRTGSCHRDSNIVIPVTIGTVPLFQTILGPGQSTEDQESFAQPSARLLQASDDAPPGYENIRPLFYERTTSVTDNFVDTDIDARHRIEGYRPEYPMYTNFLLPEARS